MAKKENDDERYWKGLGRKVRRWGEHFGDEAREFGRHAGRKVESKLDERRERKEHGEEWQHPQGHKEWRVRSVFFWPFSLLGLLGPLLGSIVWMVFLIAGLWVLKAANTVLVSGFITLMIGAVVANLQWFFAVSLFLGYCDYFMKTFQEIAFAVWPLSSSVAFTFSVWIVAWIFRVIGSSAGVGVLSGFGFWLRANLILIFAAVLVLDYAMVALWGMRRRLYYG